MPQPFGQFAHITQLMYIGRKKMVVVFFLSVIKDVEMIPFYRQPGCAGPADQPGHLTAAQPLPASLNNRYNSFNFILHVYNKVQKLKNETIY
jgi:hypothetical protein